jgi:type IV pilus assembly protein PilV
MSAVHDASERLKVTGFELGATLIEILVTMVVLSLGLLGLAAMKLVGLKDSNLGYQYTIAALQAQDMAERIGINREGASNYASIAWWTNAAVQPTSCSSICEEEEGVTTCSSPQCTAAQMALDDSWQWNLSNRQTMPRGNGSVTADGEEFAIAVRWADPGLNGELGWESTAGTDARVYCGDPASAANLNLRCYVLRYRP